MAEGILRDKAKDAGVNISIDSAGTGHWHIGQSPDERAEATAKKFGVDISALRGRQFSVSDFDEFDEIYVMDKSNYEDILALSRNQQDEEKVEMILNLTSPGKKHSVPDPYFGGISGFDKVFKMLDEACEVIIKKHKNG